MAIKTNLRLGWRELIAAFIFLTAFGINASETFKSCIHTRKTHSAYHELYEVSPFYVKLVVRSELHFSCGFVVIDENNGLLTLFATVLIAIFAGTLWWVIQYGSRLEGESWFAENAVWLRVFVIADPDNFVAGNPPANPIRISTVGYRYREGHDKDGQIPPI